MPDPSLAVRRVVLPAGTAGSWFIRMEVRAGLGTGGAPGAGSVGDIDFGVVDIAPAVGGNNGRVTIRLSGGGFSDGTEVRVRGDDVDVRAERTIASADGRELHATFGWGPSVDPDDPIVVPPGRYDVRASEGSDEATLTGSLRVIETTTDVPETKALPGRAPGPNPRASLGDPPGDVVQGGG